MPDVPSEPVKFACQHPHDRLRWLLPDGQLLPVRCHRSNRCPYCAWLTAAENIAVVALDARHDRPTVGMTLTTRDPHFSMERFRLAAAVLFKWLRRRYGSELAYLMLMEWTTGSGGHGRLPHAHVLVKRLPDEIVRSLSSNCELWRETKRHWEEQTGAWMVEMRPLHSIGGAVSYMVGHHHKREQAPPAGWSGKRFRPSKNYFQERSVAELRAEARAERRRSIALLQLALEYGRRLEGAELAELLAAKLAEPPPELVWIGDVPATFDTSGLPASWELAVLGAL